MRQARLRGCRHVIFSPRTVTVPPDGVNAHKCSSQRGFPGTVGADNHSHLAGVKRDAHALDRGLAGSVMKMQIRRRQDRFGERGLAREDRMVAIQEHIHTARTYYIHIRRRCRRYRKNGPPHKAVITPTGNSPLNQAPVLRTNVSASIKNMAASRGLVINNCR